MTDTPIPAANGISCEDCPGFANYHRDTVECPEDPDHVVTPVFITDTPLGRADDDDNLVHPIGTRPAFYAYDAG